MASPPEEDPWAAQKAEVAALEAEVAALELELDRRKVAQVGSVKWTSLVKVKEAEEEGEVSEAISAAQNELALLKCFSGIELKEVIGTPTEDGESMSYVVRGSSHGTLFALEFDINESDEGVVKMSNLKIDSMNYINNELATVLDMLESDNNAEGFASVFSAYTRCALEKSRLLQRLEEELGGEGGVVTLPGGTTGTQLFARIPTKPGIRLEYQWELEVSEALQVGNSLQLKVTQRAEKESNALSSQGDAACGRGDPDDEVLASAPGRLQELLKTLSAPEALEYSLRTLLKS